MLVEQESAKPGLEQRVGKLFLSWAPKIKAAHQTYCSLHPRAVCILDKYRDDLTKYMESRGAASPGVLVLTTMLSKPFRRLDKYSGMLQELERHVEECHPDRGDTQRSVSVYKDIAMTCSTIRRQKELELQVLTGPVRGWEGPSLTTLGDIIYMGSVAVGNQHHDRYFVLFPTTLVILSVSQRLSAFIYEGKLFLSGLTVTRLEDTEQFKNTFEISAPMIDKRVVVCQSKQEADKWVELLTKQVPRNSSASNQMASPSQAQYVPQPPPHVANLNQRGYCNRSSVLSYRTNINYTPSYPPSTYPSAAPYAGLTRFFSKNIKDKKLTRKLLQLLLYSEYLNKINLSLVKIRHHKTECLIMTKNIHIRDSVIDCDSDSDSENSDSSEDVNLIRQDAVDRRSDSSSSSSSNPFGYIRYYNPQTGLERQESPKYESFIDYGEPYKVSEPNEGSSASYGLRVVEDEPKKQSVVLISTARVNLLKKQWSEDSEASSCLVARNPGLACENLLNIDENLELNTLHVPENCMPIARQSCPTKLVGNKFNKSSLTTIYIPTWSNSDNNISCRTNFDDSKPESVSSTATHSSSLELPVNTLPLPDKIIGELLYGEFAKSESVESDLTEHSSKTVIKPPTMFEAKTVNLSKENVPFRKHSINSDKPKRRCSIQLNPTDLKDKALRKCISSRYLQMNPGSQPGPSKKSVCRCGIDYCNSPRSSDSGMAGSCSLNSPDLANTADADLERNSGDMINILYREYDLNNGLSLSEIEAKNFESQCPCSSPFGSTPRTSSEAGRTNDSLRTTSVNSIDIFPTQLQMHSRLSTSSGPQRSKSENCLLDSDSNEVEQLDGNENATGPLMFKSGLYAHWWLKAKLPPAIVRGIYEETRSNKQTADVSTGVRSQCPQQSPAEPGSRAPPHRRQDRQQYQY
ncbi:uncharacterized protein LOC132697434 isoform X2 [Cylas formicarius]|nr:uncharacterized protein LOC132697434 isoform X2 [Cylas formicarius]